MKKIKGNDPTLPHPTKIVDVENPVIPLNSENTPGPDPSPVHPTIQARLLEEPLFNALNSYLRTKPYAEVSGLMNSLSSLQVIPITFTGGPKPA
jgi:hypothetical protein